MPGPVPKDPAVRQRRNKSASRAVLAAESMPIVGRPRLPKFPGDGNWHAMSRKWWRDVWSSPMGHEFLRGDLPALFRLVLLVDNFWKFGKLEFAKEIRLLEREFGLTPLSRRRLEWTVASTEEAVGRHERNRVRRAQVIDGGDPREVLD